MMSQNQSESTDPFDLNRFVAAQEGTFEVALAELRQGRKESHWIWFIFPQVDGLGTSAMSKKFAIRSKAEARAYLDHPVLGPGLLDCCRALLALEQRSASKIMGYPDDLKLQSSMTLFSLVTTIHSEFNKVLEKYFDGEPDRRTGELVEIAERKAARDAANA